MPERFLSLCVHNQIPVWNLKNKNLYYEMELSVKDFFRLKTFRQKTGSRIVLLEKHGMPFFFQRNQKRKAFFLGSVLFLLLLYLCSLFIWDIRIEGNHYHSNETILETLETFQVTDGMLKKNLDCQQIAARIRKTFPNVVWVSAKIEGTCLILELKENEDSFEEETVKEEKTKKQQDSWDLAAKKDGVIVRMVTRSGMPLVQEGQSCKAGDILVTGRLEILNNDAAVQRYEYVKADADIDIQTEYAYYDEFLLKHSVKEYTGEEKTYPMLRLFGKEFSFGKRKTKSAEIYCTETPVYLTSSFCLPISYGTVRVVPYRKKDIVYQKEEALSLAQEHLQVFMENLVKDGAQICDKNIRVEITGEKCIAKGCVSVIEPCYQQVPVAKTEEIPPE